MMEPDAPFYLTVNHFKSSVQGQWFKAQGMGVNKMKSILKDVRRIGNSHKNKPSRGKDTRAKVTG